MDSSACTEDSAYLFTVQYRNPVSGILDIRSAKSNITLDLLRFRFGAFETFKGRLVKEDGNLSASGRLLAGLGAGICEAIFAVTPMETIKVKFINDRRRPNPQFHGFFHGVRMIIKQEGNVISGRNLWKSVVLFVNNSCRPRRDL